MRAFCAKLKDLISPLACVLNSSVLQPAYANERMCLLRYWTNHLSILLWPAENSLPSACHQPPLLLWHLPPHERYMCLQDKALLAPTRIREEQYSDLLVEISDRQPGHDRRR